MSLVSGLDDGYKLVTLRLRGPASFGDGDDAGKGWSRTMFAWALKRKQKKHARIHMKIISFAGYDILDLLVDTRGIFEHNSEVHLGYLKEAPRASKYLIDW